MDHIPTLEEIAAVSHEVARSGIRQEIDRKVGDDKSMIGTQSDVMGLLTAGQMARVVALADHASTEAESAELEILKELAGEADLIQLCRDGLAKIKSGEVVLTSTVKGTDRVFEEAFQRATATSAILSRTLANSG